MAGVNTLMDPLKLEEEVTAVRKNMGRGRIALCLWAHSVLELPAGAIEATMTEPGDELELEQYEG